jgi:hypothetical protein
MSTLNLYLPSFSLTITSDTATIYGESYQPLTGDATVDVDISTTLLKDLFNFQTDSTDINDVSLNDVLYRIVYTPSNPILPFGVDIDISSNVSFGAIASNTAGLDYNMTYDYVRFLAQSLFGTHLGVDLFNNEVALRTSLNQKFKTELHNKLVEAADYYVAGITFDNQNPSVLRDIMYQMLQNAPSRYADITTLQIGTDGSGKMWYKMPFNVGDKIYFTVTVQPATNQSLATTGATVNNRVYLIKGTLV